LAKLQRSFELSQKNAFSEPTYKYDDRLKKHTREVLMCPRVTQNRQNKKSST